MSLTEKLNRLITEVRAAKATTKKPVKRTSSTKTFPAFVLPPKAASQPVEYYDALVGKIKLKPVTGLDGDAWLVPSGFKRRDFDFLEAMIRWTVALGILPKGAKPDPEGNIDLTPIMTKMNPMLGQYLEIQAAGKKVYAGIVKAKLTNKNIATAKIPASLENSIDDVLELIDVYERPSRSIINPNADPMPLVPTVTDKIITQLMLLAEGEVCDVDAVHKYFTKDGPFDKKIGAEIQKEKKDTATRAARRLLEIVPPLVAHIKKAKAAKAKK